MFFPTALEEELEPDPFAPPPVIEYDDGEFLVDEDGHRYREVFVEDEKGETSYKKHVIRLKDGTPMDLVLEIGESVKLPSSTEVKDVPLESSEAEEVAAADEGVRPSVAESEQTGDNAPQPTEWRIV